MTFEKIKIKLNYIYHILRSLYYCTFDLQYISIAIPFVKEI